MVSLDPQPLPTDSETLEPSGYVCCWSDYAVWVKQKDGDERVATLNLAALTGEGSFNTSQTLSEVLQLLQDSGLDKVAGNIAVAQDGELHLRVKSD